MDNNDLIVLFNLFFAVSVPVACLLFPRLFMFCLFEWPDCARHNDIKFV